MMRALTLASVLALALTGAAQAQTSAAAPEYATRPAAPALGQAPGLKVTELNSKTRNFELVFAKGDEVGAGLAEFATKNHITNAHFTAIGALSSAVIGWADPSKKGGTYKIDRLNEEMEITSFSGNIVRDAKGNPVVHAHCVVALFRDGSVHAGHFLEGHISLTMQMHLEDSEPLAQTADAGNN